MADKPAPKPTPVATPPATPTKPKAPPRTEADKANKFRQLINKRVPKLLKQIVAVGNLSAKGNYVYSDEQVDKVFGLIHEALRTARARFQGAKDVAKVSVL
jgi:hypothetical protein